LPLPEPAEAERDLPLADEVALAVFRVGGDEGKKASSDGT
jgi:hypothetical protein